MALDISKLGRKSFISQSALAEVLTAIKNSGEIPLHTSKSTVKRRREDAISQVETPYGPIIETLELDTVDGGQIRVPMCNPAAWMYHTSRTCPRMMRLLNQASQTVNNINRPWRIILYCDEISPGNQLKVHNRRKLQSVYFSVQEYGGFELTQEHAWSVLTCIRTDLVNKLQDGMSQFFRHCVKAFLKTSGNMSTGISVQVHGEDRIMCFVLSYILADEAALKQVVENKGASGKMLCLFCQTTVNARYRPANLGQLVLHTVTDASQLCLHSDNSVWQIIDYLNAESTRGTTKEHLSELEMKFGFNHCPAGLLLDVGLRQWVRPISMVAYDPMHVFLVSGVWHREMTLLLGRLADDGFKQSMLHDWTMAFIWPDIHGGASCSARLVFKKKKESDQEFKCTSSDALAVYPVVRSFLHHTVQTPTDELHLAIKSYYSLCEILDSLKLTATGAIDAKDFQDKVESHLRNFVAPCLHVLFEHGCIMCRLNAASFVFLLSCQACYGESHFLPKHHFALHLGWQLQKHGLLCTCFVHEWRHKIMKRPLYFAGVLLNATCGCV